VYVYVACTYIQAKKLKYYKRIKIEKSLKTITTYTLNIYNNGRINHDIIKAR